MGSHVLDRPGKNRGVLPVAESHRRQSLRSEPDDLGPGHYDAPIDPPHKHRLAAFGQPAAGRRAAEGSLTWRHAASSAGRVTISRASPFMASPADIARTGGAGSRAIRQRW